jgi:response regulator RpfG family c-di-GMP phosphodiesterase
MVKNLNILLIEDDLIEVMKLNRTISSLGLNHKIIEANNGEDALKL